MFRTTLKFLSLIVLPHPELPTPVHRPIRRPHTATGDSSTVTPNIPVFSQEKHAIHPSGILSNAVTSTPRKSLRPKSLDVTAVSAYSTAVSWRRNTLCICPEHCPPQNSSPTDTFFTCPQLSDSVVSSLKGCSNHSFSRRLSINRYAVPPSPSPCLRPPPQVLSSCAHSSSTASPSKDISMGSIDDVVSSSSLTPRRSLRRSTHMVVSTPPSAKLTPARHSDLSVSSLIASPSRQEGSDNGRRSDVNSQTRLFELELSPILEDTHVVDHHLGSVEFAENDSPDLTQKYDGDASDSSLGSLLDFQSLGSDETRARCPPSLIMGLTPRSDANTSEVSENGYCIPALTFTSPTPETLQSVVFCDTFSPGPYRDQRRSRSLSLRNSRVSTDMSCLSSQPQKGRAQLDEYSFLAVSVQSEEIRRREPKGLRRRARIWNRAWKRISRIPQAVLTLGTNTSSSGYSREGQIDIQISETSIPFDDAAEGYGFHIIGRRPLFGIPTLARRRLAKRHDPSKRYSIPF